MPQPAGRGERARADHSAPVQSDPDPTEPLPLSVWPGRLLRRKERGPSMGSTYRRPRSDG